jgi:hypothetical protein
LASFIDQAEGEPQPQPQPQLQPQAPPGQPSPVTVYQDEAMLLGEPKWAAALSKDRSIWGRLTTDFGLLRKSKEAKFGQMVMNGIPDGLRSRVWELIIDPDGAQREGMDSHFFRRVPPPAEAIRTAIRQALDQMPISQAEKPKLQEPVYRVLHAYTCCDSQLGYVQGMEVYPALLLSKMDEDRAFRCLCRLMRDTKHSLREFFVSDFAKLRSLNIVWDNIIRSKFPKIHANLKRLHIDHMTYTSKWFLTAFLTLRFPPKFKLRIFDRYAAFGMRALLSLGITMIGELTTALETGDQEMVLGVLLNPMAHRKPRDWRKLIDKCDKAFLSERRYEKLFKMAGVDLFCPQD